MNINWGIYQHKKLIQSNLNSIIIRSTKPFDKLIWAFSHLWRGSFILPHFRNLEVKRHVKPDSYPKCKKKTGDPWALVCTFNKGDCNVGHLQTLQLDAYDTDPQSF